MNDLALLILILLGLAVVPIVIAHSKWLKQEAERRRRDAESRRELSALVEPRGIPTIEASYRDAAFTKDEYSRLVDDYDAIEKWRKIDNGYFRVSGSIYYADAVETLVGFVRDGLEDGGVLIGLREPNNEYDRNAIGLYIDGLGVDDIVGYVPKKIAKSIARKFPDDMPLHFEVKRISSFSSGDPRLSGTLSMPGKRDPYWHGRDWPGSTLV